MSKPHYIVRRSRSGRFNFTLLSSYGRVTGLVMIQVAGKTKIEIEQAADDQIRHLVADLANASRVEMNFDFSGTEEFDATSTKSVEDVHMDAAAA